MEEISGVQSDLHGIQQQLSIRILYNSNNN